MNVKCAWCDIVMIETPEDQRESHGICDECSEHLEADLARKITLQEQLSDVE